MQYFKHLDLSQAAFSEKVLLCYKLINDFGFESYQDIKGTIVKHNIAERLDSIHWIKRNYDVFYLDEFKRLLTAFENPTLRQN